MIDAVMFDMDGVLVDSEPAHCAVTREALLTHGLPAPGDADWERVFFGRPDRDGLAEWFLEHRVAVDIETVMSDKLRRFEEQFTKIVGPCEDGQWLARALHASGVPLALVTGARRAEADLVLERFGLCDVFPISISADDVVSGKPDPEPYQRGAAALRVEPARCLVIEDSVVGLRAAEAAGASVIVVDRLARPERFGATVPVTRLDDIVLAGILAQGQ